MESTPRWEFPLPRDVGLRSKLEEKRKEYWQRIDAPDPATTLKRWPWHECDLIRRYEMDESFRLLYYKFVVLTDVLMACEKHDQHKAAGQNGLPETIDGKLIGIDLATALARPLYPDEFNAACQVISNYLTGTESL